jgi:hypothetical protein
MMETWKRSCFLTDIIVQNGPRLPYELIANIAEHLQDDIAKEGLGYSKRTARTLAALNRVSRAVHEVTLPHLYRRVLYTSFTSFAKSVLSKPIPKGWKHVK